MHIFKTIHFFLLKKIEVCEARIGHQILQSSMVTYIGFLLKNNNISAIKNKLTVDSRQYSRCKFLSTGKKLALNRLRWNGYVICLSYS